MKIDVTYVFRSFNGQPIKAGDSNSDDMTMKDLCVKCLTVMDERTANIDAVEKYRRGTLAEKIYKADGTVDLSVEEAALLKELIGLFGSALIVKQSWDLLDPPPVSTEPS